MSGRDEAVRFAGEPGTACCQGGDLRCGCGHLLARVVGRQVELKCRRCKKIWRIPLSGA